MTSIPIPAQEEEAHVYRYKHSARPSASTLQPAETLDTGDSPQTISPSSDGHNPSHPTQPAPRHTINISSSTDIIPVHFLNGHLFEPRLALPASHRVIHLQPPNPLQQAITENGVPFHVQFELERRVSTVDNLYMRDFFPEDYVDLCGSIAESEPRINMVIRRVIAHRATHPEDTMVYKPHDLPSAVHVEADKEEHLIQTNRGHLELDAYGGKIMYAVHITFDNVHGDFRVDLLPPELAGKSCQIMRMMGSRRVIVLRYNERVEEKLMFHLCVGRIFILFGRPYRAVFRPIHSHSIYCVETADHIPRVTFPDPRDPPALPYLDILSIFNSHETRQKESMVKFAARLQLPFSSTRPAVLLERSAVQVIPDILSHEATQERYDGHQVLTDGCGFISRRLYEDNSRMTLLDDVKRTLQVRINGCKGLVALMSEEQQREYAGKDIILRRSMVKAYPSAAYADHPANLTLNIVRYGILKFGTSMFSDALLALVHCGVPHSVLLKLFTASVEELAINFSPSAKEGESSDDVLRRIHGHCYGRGGVKSLREAKFRMSKGKGPCEDGGEWDRKGKGEDGSNFLDELYGHWNFGDTRVKPFSAVERLMECVAAGIHPSTSAFATDALHDTAQDLLEAAFTRLKVYLPQSLYAFATPDHTGLLKPDEIQITFSKGSRSECLKKFGISHISGEVLVFRSPCTTHNDIRKYRIVDYPQLRHRVDEVIFCANSELLTEGQMIHHSLGDYDGDAVFVIWDQELVKPFKDDKDKSFGPPAGFTKENFEVVKLRGKDFVAALDKVQADEEARILNYQYFLLLSLSWDNPLGLYYNMHDNAVYELGYDHPETVRLAHIFNAMLDAPKTGLAIRGRVRRDDYARYSRNLVGWKRLDNSGYKACRPKGLGPFIMDELRALAIRKRAEIEAAFPACLTAPSTAVHVILCSIYRYRRADVAKSGETELHKQLATLEKHVRRCLDIWQIVESQHLPASVVVGHLYDLDSADVCQRYRDAPRWSDHPNPATGRPWTRNEIRRLKNVQKAYLAQILQKYPDPDGVGGVWVKGDPASLSKMKVSCAVVLAKEDAREMVPFDLDFGTTCKMMAESYNGKHRSVIEAIYASVGL